MDEIRTIQIGTETWYRGTDISKVTGIKNIRHTMTKFPKEETKMIPINTNFGVKPCKFLNNDGLKRLLCNSRKLSVQNLCREIGLDVTDTHYVKVETSCIEFLMKAFDGVTDAFPQYWCGKYQIDLYFPYEKVAVECDENCNHTSETAIKKDDTRQKYIEKTLGCTFVRFSPEKEGFDISRVVNMCMKEFFKDKSSR